MSEEGVQIRRILADEWGELRELRLRALVEAPDAFGSAYEAESNDPEETWREWAAEGADGGSCFVAIALDGERWIGMAMGAPHRDHPGEAGLFAMWVDPADRGEGIGRRLVSDVIAWADAAGFPALRLRVTTTNEAATHLYETCGFVDTGGRAPLRDGSDVIAVSMILTRPA
ncbi:MAG: N-acetyltransferase family protein [Actinomycetota bacterium]